MYSVMDTLRRVASGIVHGILGLIPSRTKRLIVLASLASQFKYQGSLHGSTLSILTVEKLNDLMKLCTDQNALAVPGRVGRILWQDQMILDVFQTLYQSPTTSPIYLKPLADRILSVIPSWLRYAQEETMKNELVTMLQYEKAQLA